MKKTKQLILNFALIVSILLTIFFAIKWLYSDNSGEAAFAIFIGVFIPILIYLKNKSKIPLEINPISIKINRKKIKCYTRDIDYAIQLDIEIFAKQKTSIKNLYIIFKESVGYSKKYRKINNFHLFLNNNDDLLKYDFTTYQKELNRKDNILDIPFVINESEHKFFTISEHIKGERLPDGWEGLSLDEWYLYIEYNEDKQYKEKILFEIDESSIKQPSEYVNVGFCN